MSNETAETTSRYMALKAATKCIRCSRKLPAEHDHQVCPKCLPRHKWHAKMGMRALRRARRNDGQCAACGIKSETYRCAACSTKAGRVPKDGGYPQGEAQRTDDQWRRDANGWARYRGKGRRGAPTAAANDDQDLESALDALVKGRKALAYARSPAVRAMPRIQRNGVMGAATSLIALAARFLDDVVERNGKAKGDGAVAFRARGSR